MANQRPIRRPPIPRWKRGRRRPVRWIEGNSHNSNLATCVFDTVNDMQCEPQTPRVLLDGDSDFEWADRNEVRVDRIVGTLSWRGDIYEPGLTAGGPPPAVVRFGIIAIEEAEGVFPFINLFDREALEEFQWMWLYQSMGNVQYDAAVAEGQQIVKQYEDVRLDIRTRRSIGKKDAIVLYSQFAYLSDQPLAAGTVGLNPQYVHSLRCIIRS